MMSVVEPPADHIGLAVAVDVDIANTTLLRR
jgi:hypothetical protein